MSTPENTTTEHVDQIDRPEFMSIIESLPTNQRYIRRKQAKGIVIFEWAVILIAGGGFTYKFIEFTISVMHVQSDAVNFAITPLVMYVCVALGFFLLFIWSILRGDYKETEYAKFRLFEREAMIDREESIQEEILHPKHS
jgi:hypothetical protein